MVQACDDIISGKLNDQFPTDPIQGGAGTSFNMNTNEVICNRALEILGVRAAIIIISVLITMPICRSPLTMLFLHPSVSAL